MEIQLIKTKKDYNATLERIDVLFNAEPDTPEGDELDILITLVQKYEKEHFAMPEPHPIEAIKFMMEQKGMNRKDLAIILNAQGRVSEILNLKRRLSISIIRKIHKHLGVPAETLIRNYELSA